MHKIFWGTLKRFRVPQKKSKMPCHFLFENLHMKALEGSFSSWPSCWVVDHCYRIVLSITDELYFLSFPLSISQQGVDLRIYIYTNSNTAQQEKVTCD